ncbi:hypothetical protein AGR5A_Lc90156 [Agrobacterium genomosp. 5 str. CFBP 6626]|nr:hypothetical protein AGR5A_Lc90156 [Agrobacterium genomosp. 5 str. CFBP 6626]
MEAIFELRLRKSWLGRPERALPAMHDPPVTLQLISTEHQDRLYRRTVLSLLIGERRTAPRPEITVSQPNR